MPPFTSSRNGPRPAHAARLVFGSPEAQGVTAENSSQKRSKIPASEQHRSERKARLLEQMELQLEELEAAATTEDELAAEKVAAQIQAARSFERKRAARDRAKAALERAKEHVGAPIRLDPVLIERFGRTMRENFSTGSIPFRKAYLQSLIDAIEVDDHQIRIKGSKDLLEKAVLVSQSGQSWCSQMSSRWRARRDSNS